MTTRVYVVNIGSWPIEVQRVDPTTGKPSGMIKTLFPGDSENDYVYDTQAVLVTERKPDEKNKC